MTKKEVIAAVRAFAKTLRAPDDDDTTRLEVRGWDTENMPVRIDIYYVGRSLGMNPDDYEAPHEAPKEKVENTPTTP